MNPFAAGRPFSKLLDLVLVAAGFASAVGLYSVLYPDNYLFLTQGEALGGFLISVATFWLVLRMYDGTGPDDGLLLLVDQFCLGTGVILILHAILNYFHILTRSLFLIVIGGLITAFLLAVARILFQTRAPNPRNGVLVIGVHPLAQRLAASLNQPVLGMLSGGAAPSTANSNPAIPWLGDFSQLEQIVRERAPAHILVTSLAALLRLPPSLLLNYRLSGGEVNEIPALYERLFHRVYCQRLEPAELVLSPALRANSRAMAIQAIYTNLLGLFLLLALAPILLLVAIAVALFSGPGPVIESAECAGFQNIPFRLLCFRTRRRDGSGEPTRVGPLISRLRLANLPRLLNIVRGDMALLGPAPVRCEFARRLTEVLPFYSLRFSVKPGIFGWAELHLPNAAAQSCEILRTEYDLYYVKEASPLFDLELVLRLFTGGADAAPRSAEILEAGH
ncbi:MAG TPA: sugar transferase [Bryobacteraceae bacterium]|nr:sugar transferase [Bryobacteraceae bacterium]